MNYCILTPQHSLPISTIQLGYLPEGQGDHYLSIWNPHSEPEPTEEPDEAEPTEEPDEAEPTEEPDEAEPIEQPDEPQPSEEAHLSKGQ